MSNLQVTVEKVEKKSNILRQLKVRVPAKVVSSHLEKGLREVQKTAKLKGFRPGHVPLPVVKQFYGEDVRHQVFHDLIDESFQEAVRGEKLRAVGRPQIETPDHKTGAGEHDHSIEEGKDLTYVATVEVMPDIEVKGYTGISLTRESTKVEKSDIQKIIDNFQNSQAQLVPITNESHKARKGDSVEMKFEGGLVVGDKVEPKAGMSGSRLLEIGSDTLIPGFEDNLVGMKKGETKTFKIDFPKDFYEKELAGQPASFTVTINEIKEKQLPELNDEFAKQMGYESLADLNQKVEDHLAQEKKSESDRKLRSDLLQALIDKNAFDVPQSLIQAQARALAQDVAQNLKRQGADDKTVQEILMSEMQNISKKAESQVKASLLVEAVAKAEKFEVTAEDLEAEISKMAISMKAEEQKVKEFYMSNPSRKEDLEYRIREERTLGWLLEKAKIKDAK
ncbi:MAG: trigger factor [Bdellovibrionales bacterium]|nr:trigger factor [Bdellovibrionales bacterium]